MTLARQMKPLAAATALLALLFAAPATAQDPPAPPQLTCADWGAYRFFEMASPDTITACLAAGANPGAPVDAYRGTPLHHAARAGSDPILINLLIAAGADIGARDRRGRTPLHESARANPSPSVIAALLGADADVNAPDLRGTTPLHEAARVNPNPRATVNPEIVAILLEAGADVNARDDRDRTPLHAAWQNPPADRAWLDPPINAEAVRLLLAAGADPLALDQRGQAAAPGTCRNWALAVFARVATPDDYAACAQAGTDVGVRDESGYTVLHHATVLTDTAVIRLLLEAGADPSVRSYDDHTPLHFALRHRNSAVAAILVRAGSDVNAAENDEITPLHLAGYDSAATTLLLEAGADVHAEADGTALHRATTAGVVDALLDAGADIEAPGRFGTPLMVSVRPAWPRSDSISEVFARLLERGADPNARSLGGRTALHAAVLRGAAVIRALLDAGADPSLADDSGETLLHQAARYSSSGPVAIPLLLEAGLDVDSPNDNGETPLHLAAGAVRNTANVALLLDVGADATARTREGDTPLHAAVSARYPDTVTVAALVGAGADIDARNGRGRTPAQVAWMGGHSQVVDHLLALGANSVALDEADATEDLGCDWSDRHSLRDVTIASARGCVEAGTALDAHGDFGDTPLIELAGSQSHDARTLGILRVLLEAGADVNGRTANLDRTALHAVASSLGSIGAGTAEFTRALLEAGANVNAADERGWTPLHSAAASRRQGVGDSLLIVLLEAGADVNAAAENGQTPLHLALNNPPAVTALLEFGADRTAADDSGRLADPIDCANFVTRSFLARAPPDIVAGCIADGAGVNIAVSVAQRSFAAGLFEDRPLHTAAESARDPATITALLAAEAALQGRDGSDRTPLHYAAAGGTPAVVRALLQAGAQVNMRASGFGVDSGWDWTPLHLAAQANPDPQVVRALLAAGADVDARAYYGQTPLHLAASNENPEIATILLEAGADVNAGEWMGRTPLHAAAAGNENPAVINLLIEAGAHLQAVGNRAEEYIRIYSPLDGATPLHEAAATNRNPAVVEALVRAGADVDSGRPPDAAAAPIEHAGTFLTELAIRNITDPGHTSPLHLAALRNRNPAVVEARVALGADIERRGRDGSTALHMAARNNPTAFPALLALGADGTAVDDEGLTPWDYAKDNKALHGLPEVRRLRKAEQEGNPCDDWNSFAFFRSASPDDVRKCLDAGADPNARNPDGATPLHLAAHRSEFPEIVAILVEAGADPSARGPFGLTPLHMTWSERGSPHAGVYHELLRLGADPLARDDRGRIADPTHCEHWNTRAFARLAARSDFARCLEQGADVLARDDNRYFANDGGYTVLHHATANEDGSVIALLVAAGAELEARNDYGFTPLHRAVSNDRLTAVTALLAAGADIEADAGGIWGTPLISATVGISGTRFNRNATTMAIIDALLAAGADVNAVDEDGDTPLLNVLRKGPSGLASGIERLRGTEATADSVVHLAMKLLEAGADPGAQGARGQTPLHEAAEYRTPVLVQALLDAGADPRVRNEWGGSPLHSAARTGTPEIIALLVAAGAEVNGRDEYGRSPLHVAVASVPYTFEGGDPKPEAGPWLLRTGALLEAGADPNLPDAAGNTPLHLAAEELDTSLLSLLAGAGADVNARNDSGETPLVTARNHANVPVLRQLLDLGADAGVLEETGGIDGPLCDLSGSRFVSRAPPESLRDCLEAGVSVNAPGDFGRTPLLQLAGSGYLSYDAPDYDGPDKVTLLLDAGANPNARLGSGRTALHLVAEADTDYDGRRMWDSDAGRAAATALIQAGADMEARDTLGETPLHKAARWVSRDTISLESLLLDAGADVNARANDGQTPLHLAASHDHPLVVSALVEAGAEVDARTNDGLTPLHMALRWGRPAVAATLLSSGADPDALDGAGNPVDPTDCARWGFPSFFAFATAADVEGCLAAGADPHAGRPQGEPRDNRPNIISFPPPPPLHLAAAGARDPAVITAFLAGGADVDARDRSDRTPLHAAARSGTAAVVRALLDAGAEVDARARRFDPFSGVTNTPLHEAAGNPDPEVAAALLDAGADVNGRGSGGATPLLRAARNENPAVAALLLGAGAEVNAATSDGLTPLHTAAAGNSNPAVIALLLEAGADVDARGAYNHSHAPFGSVTPLHTAAYWNRNPEIVTMLVAAGADPDGGDAPADTAAGQVTAIVANSPLYLAVSNNPNPAVIEALVRAGADLERAGASGRTVLHRAAVYVPRAFPLLLRLGADPEALDAEGKTPMDLARENPALRPWERVRTRSPGGARGPQNAAPPTAASAAPATPAQPSCAAWGTPDFFASASAELVRECIQAGVDPEAPVQYVPVIFNAARTSTDPAVIGVLTDAGADPNFRFGEWQLGLGTARRGYTPLHTAAAQNPNPGIVGALLAVGAELEARDAFGATPLRVAWANPNPAVFRTLLRLGADPLARDDGGRPADPTSCLNWTTPDFWRLARPDEAEVCLALDEDLEARDRNGNTPLHLAVRVVNAVAVAILLDADADLGARNNSGATPLHVAAVHDDAEVLDLLLKAGADIDAGAGGRGTPLLDALRNRRGFRTGPTGEVAVNALLRAGADFNAADSAGNVPLLASMDPERPEGLLADLPLRLLALGANPNWRDGRGRTPLHAAAAVGREDVIRALIDAGADPQAMTDDGATTLHAAAVSGSPEAIALLSGMGMDTNFRNDDGLAPLHLAVQRTNALLFEVMRAVGEQSPPAWIRRARALLDAGADPSARTPEGDTPLHLSMWHHDSTLVVAFVQAGADLNARNDRGETALHVARARDNRPAVRTLLNLGADPGPVCHWAPGSVDGVAWDFLAQAPAESVRGCLESGIPADERDEEGATFLARMITTSGCCSDFENVLAAFLEAGADVNARDDAGRTPLHRAVGMSGRLDAETLAGVTSALLAAGADPTARDSQGSTPLHIAAAAWREAARLERLLASAGADVNARNDAGETPLHIALRGHLLGDDAEMVRTLVELGADPAVHDGAGVAADPTACERWGQPSFFALASADFVAECISRGADVRVGTGPLPPAIRLPLHTAAAHTRNPAVVQLLLDAGADVHARDAFREFTALHHAAENGTVGAVRALLEAGAEPDAWAMGFSADWGWGWTPLHLAVRSNPDPEVARALLEAGANLAARSGESYRAGDSPLHYAGENPNPEVAGALLEAGAEVNALSRAHRTPLHEAAANASNPAVIELLAAAGADVNAADRSGYTPLHSAAWYNHRPEIATALIAAGADINARDPDGQVPSGRRANHRTPLFMAVYRGGSFIGGQPMPTERSVSVVQVLMGAGADPEQADRNGRTPLHAAALSNPAVFPLLLRLGADPGARDADGRTPLDYARENRALEGLPEVRRLRATATPPSRDDRCGGGCDG